MQLVEVRSRTLQGTSQEPALPTIRLDILHEEISVAELIRRTVEEQIRELQVARKLNVAQTQQVLDKQYLTQEEVAEQAETGTIRLAPATSPQEARVSTTAEVRKAWRAFEKQAYLVIVDGRRVTTLNEIVVFQPGSAVTFVRLMPLIGG